MCGLRGGRTLRSRKGDTSDVSFEGKRGVERMGAGDVLGVCELFCDY
jgi:hypothetical protein